MMQGPQGEKYGSRRFSTRTVKNPPHSREAEQSLLGGLLLDAQTWDKVAEMVTKEDFYLPEHR